MLQCTVIFKCIGCKKINTLNILNHRNNQNINCNKCTTKKNLEIDKNFWVNFVFRTGLERSNCWSKHTENIQVIINENAMFDYYQKIQKKQVCFINDITQFRDYILKYKTDFYFDYENSINYNYNIEIVKMNDLFKNVKIVIHKIILPKL